jgi:hypothetical protein
MLVRSDTEAARLARRLDDALRALRVDGVSAYLTS